MAPALGKRKRITREELERASRSPSPSSSSDSQDSDSEDVQALFRKAFEAKFKPLDIEPVQKKVKESEIERDDAEVEEEEEGSDWSGINSEDEDEDEVEVVDYADNTRKERERVSKAELRAFMSNKPPPLSTSSSTITKTSTKAKPAASDASDPTELSHLKNDLELQNLLRESTLLSAYNPTYSTRGAASDGAQKPSSITTRHKLADMHMQSLGAKGSAFAQKSMPMSLRKGITAKAKLREDLRRKEAKENGIILEREKRKADGGAGKKASSAQRRDRGIGGPSVGKFRNGALTLSKRDVASITRDGGSGGRGGKGKKGRR